MQHARGGRVVRRDPDAAPAPPRRADDAAGRVLGLQRALGNAAVSRMLSRASGPVLQRAWMFCPDMRKNERQHDVYYWDGNGPEPDMPPGVVRRFGLTKVAAAAAPAIRMPEGQYLTFVGGGSTAKRDTYNPFGRFNEDVTKTAFLAFEGSTVPTELGVQGEHEDVLHVSQEVVANGLPAFVITTNGSKLHLMGVVPPWGMVFGDGARMPLDAKAGPLKSQRVGQPSGIPQKIKQALDTLGRSVEAQTINASVLSGYKGSRKEDVGQITLMGVTAGDVAAAAGYDAAVDPEYALDTSKLGKKKKGWEWLHLVAYELGGPSSTGPQSASNLVVGTTAANTSMIMVEDAIVDAIQSGYAKSADVNVVAMLADEEYRIAETIAYQISFTLPDGRTVEPPHIMFSALSVSTPFVAANRYFRQMLRHHLKEAAKADEAVPMIL